MIESYDVFAAFGFYELQRRFRTAFDRAILDRDGDRPLRSAS